MRIKHQTREGALVIPGGDHVSSIIPRVEVIRAGDPEHLRDKWIILEFTLIPLGMAVEFLLGDVLSHPAGIPQAAVIGEHI